MTKHLPCWWYSYTTKRSHIGTALYCNMYRIQLCCTREVVSGPNDVTVL